MHEQEHAHVTQPSPEPGPSVLFPDVTPDDYAEAAKQAELLSPAVACDADDVLLAAHLSAFGDHLLTTGKAKGVKIDVSAVRTLFDPAKQAGLCSLVTLAKLLRRLYDPATRPATIEAAALDLTTTITTVLVSVAPDKRKLKAIGG